MPITHNLPNFGRWSPAEVHFLQHLVECYVAGILEEDADAVPTLRQYLARQLQCDAMRVTKRLKKGKSLATYLILRNFNRTMYKPRGDYTAADVDKVAELKHARNAFEVALRTKRKATDRRGYLSVHELVTDEDWTDGDDGAGSSTSTVVEL